MVLFNHATREMTAKIVYYGPGLCGKTTNLLVIFDKLDPKSKGKMLSLATKTDRTLFFDLLPVDIGKVGNFNLKIQLYTVPGQVFYNETRKLVLKGADAVVFVADSQPSMIESNRESFANLMENLEENEVDSDSLPIVIQYNKRDIPGVLPVEKIQAALGFEDYASMEASAIKGEGVMETFKLVSKITAKHLIGKLQGKPAKQASKKSSKKSAAVSAAATASAMQSDEPVPAEPLSNPFAESVPFPEAGPIDSAYDGMEEVSLEQLLEGRDRPSTISGQIAIPVDLMSVTTDDEVDHLDVEELLAPPSAPFGIGEQSAAVSISEPQVDRSEVGEDQSRIEELEREVLILQEEILRFREEREQLLDELRQSVANMTRLIGL
ncbi:MAG TPA: GTPase domain-containing protein [Thermoanaerobaculia bacterium]|nr:GTPase domain-containing protein [Thermoanaerobaculia bacterium]